MIIAGIVLHSPLSSISENTLKFSVGLLLTAFGTFWSGEGIGVLWPGEDLMLIILLIAYGLLSWGLVLALRRMEARSTAAAGGHS